MCPHCHRFPLEDWVFCSRRGGGPQDQLIGPGSGEPEGVFTFSTETLRQCSDGLVLAADVRHAKEGDGDGAAIGPSPKPVTSPVVADGTSANRAGRGNYTDGFVVNLKDLAHDRLDSGCAASPRVLPAQPMFQFLETCKQRDVLEGT